MPFHNVFKHDDKKQGGYPGSNQGKSTPPPVPTATRPSASPAPAAQQGSDNPNSPRFFNISNNATVHERILLVHGGAGPQGVEFDASVVVYHHLNSFPAQRFPVADGFFKALVHLEPGENHLRFSFETGHEAPLETRLTLTYIPPTQNPPLHLVLLLGKDSEGTFDSPKYKRESEGNSLEVAVKKMRMTGYMMSAFTGEQMFRNGFRHRSFRLYEEWTSDTLSNRDKMARSTAKVHIVRCNETVDQIRDPNIAQQCKGATDKNKLFSIALDALRAQGGLFDNGNTAHVACIFVDAHWNVERQLITGHAALGGGHGNIRLAIFGGHALYTWPKCIEDIVPTFMDDTTTDTREVANDSDQSGTTWENCNVGQGAFMHEIGHLLGCPHQPHGVMLRDYITWNRSFMVREANHCARTGKPGMRLTLPKDECGWHRLDTLRFRFHPSFRLPHEHPPPLDASKPNLYPVSNGAVANSATGIYLIEIHIDNDPRGHLEFINEPQREILLTEDYLRSQVPEKYKDPNKDIKLEILALGEQQVTVDNFKELMGRGRYGRGNAMTYRSNKLGGNNYDETSIEFPQRGIPITCIRVFAGRAVDGVQFFFGDGSSEMFGKQGGKPNDVTFQQGEVLMGFYCRTGAWVDGISVVTNMQRSKVFGNPTGGSGHDLIAPGGHYVHGLYGNIGPWTISIGLIYCE